MKNLLFIFSISFLMLFSCSSNSDDITDTINENTILLKKIVSSSDGTTLYSYDGTKLYRITDQDGSYEEFTYSGDLITNVQTFNSNGQPDDYVEFFEYANGKLSNEKTYSNSVLVWELSYTYLENKIKIIYELQPIHHVLAYLDAKGNIYKLESFNNNQIYQTRLFSFDNKNNPLKNVTGIDGHIFLSRGLYSHINNELTVSNGLGETLETNIWQYNDNNFPVSLENFGSVGNSKGTATFHY